MKRKGLLKTLLLLCALVVGGGSVWAEDEPELTLDFTSSWGTGTTSGDVTSYTKTIEGTSYTISGAGGTNFKFSSGYFIFGKSGAYINLPKVDYAVEKIVVIGNAAGSSAVKMNLFVGETAVSTETTGCGEGSSGGTASTLTYNIASGSQAANTQYTLKVTSSHNAQITYVKYYKKTSGGGGGSSSTVATPTFNHAGGTYTSAQSVEISCDTEDASIYYTTNGNNPDDSSTPYTSAISITTSGTTLKAIAYKDGMTASSIASATYTIKPTTPTINAAGATVTITGAEGCTFYYTTDNSAPSSTSTKYTAPFDLTEDCTIKAIAYDTYNNASDVKSYTFKYMPLSPKNINSGYYEKVTDASQLENGDAILIVNEDAEVALGPQSGNNCPAKDVIINNDVISDKGDALKLVLVKKTEKVGNADTDVFYFYTGTGYLYASSNSSNYLKEQDPATSNARATISITGDAAIVFKGSYSHNIVRYNGSGTSNLFSCYASGQSSVQIYKEVAHNETATISSVNWTTFSSPYALDFKDFTDANAYMVTGASGTTLTLTQVTGKVPANTGLLISGTASATVNIPVTASSTTDVSANKLKPGTGATVNAADKYVLVARDGKAVFAPTSGAAANVAVGKAYLDLGGVSARGFVLDESETTGITSMHNSQSIMHNGIFDLQGRRVSQPTKGLYIVNGKKVIIK